MKINLYLLTILFFTLLSCGDENSDSNDVDPVEEVQIELGKTNQTIEHNGITRTYVQYVPNSYNHENPTPLVINFHGNGGDAQAYADSTGDFYEFHNVSESGKFIVVYPQGVIRVKGAAEWDPGDNSSTNINDNDLFFTEKLIEDIDETYNIDLTKVYAVGFSNGGMMAYGLACKRPTKIAAIGIMSGIMLPDDSCNSSEYTSVIHFHGTYDTDVPYNGELDFDSVPYVVNFWLNHNSIPQSSETITQLNGGVGTKTEYTGGNGNTDFTLYKIDEEYGKEGGHVWFGDAINGKIPGQIMWDFLSNYTTND
mgnify:FL=1